MPLYHICFDGSVGLVAITFKAFFQCVILLNLQVAYCKMAVENFWKPPFLDPVHAPVYVEVFAGPSGKTLTSAEKHASIAEKMNSQGVVLGWPTVTASNVDNKIDAVRRKGKKIYTTRLFD